MSLAPSSGVTSFPDFLRNVALCHRRLVHATSSKSDESSLGARRVISYYSSSPDLQFEGRDQTLRGTAICVLESEIRISARPTIGFKVADVKKLPRLIVRTG